MLVILLIAIAWLAAIALVVMALAVAAHRADLRSERWARARIAQPRLPSGRGRLAA